MRNYLVNHGDLENIGGLAYLAEIISSVPTAANANSMPRLLLKSLISVN